MVYNSSGLRPGQRRLVVGQRASAAALLTALAVGMTLAGTALARPAATPPSAPSISLPTSAPRCAVVGCLTCARGRIDTCVACEEGAYVLSSGQCDCAPNFGSTIEAFAVPLVRSSLLPVACQPPLAPRVLGGPLPACVCKRCPTGMVSEGGKLGSREASCARP